MKHTFIRKSSSPYSSSIVFVRKKDCWLRMCIDYRSMNGKTIPISRHPIPNVQGTLNSLGGNSSPFLTKGKHTTRAGNTQLLPHFGDCLSMFESLLA